MKLENFNNSITAGTKWLRLKSKKNIKIMKFIFIFIARAAEKQISKYHSKTISS